MTLSPLLTGFRIMDPDVRDDECDSLIALEIVATIGELIRGTCFASRTSMAETLPKFVPGYGEELLVGNRANSS